MCVFIMDHLYTEDDCLKPATSNFTFFIEVDTRGRDRRKKAPPCFIPAGLLSSQIVSISSYNHFFVLVIPWALTPRSHFTPYIFAYARVHVTFCGPAFTSRSVDIRSCALFAVDAIFFQMYPLLSAMHHRTCRLASEALVQ